jgi:flagellar basal-body rod protein FlgB
MDITQIPLFSALGKRMGWLTARQGVVSQNIANADTPNFKPSDLKPQSFRELVQTGAGGAKAQGAKLQMTSAKHMQGREAAAAPYEVEEDRQVYEISPTGNGVVLEEQLMKLAETQIDYQLSTSLYKKHLGMIRAAIGRR